VTFLVIDKKRFAYLSQLAPKSSNSVPFRAESGRVFGPHEIHFGCCCSASPAG
jgi:hypothetical protein